MNKRRWLFIVAGLMLSAAGSAQETTIRGFADVGLTVSNKESSHTFFSLGQYDLYISSRLSDRISFIGETVFEYDEGFIVDVERVLVKYEFQDYFNVVVGKHHTPIGYWNTAYHHGTLLQPTIQRPIAFLFEDEGGILPIHTTGVLLTGSSIGRLNFGYDFMIGNGIGASTAEDNDDYKSYSLTLRADPVDGLRLGVSFHGDRISAGVAGLQGMPLPVDVKQRLLTGTLVYWRSPYEFIGEFLRATNQPGAADKTAASALYLYGGYRLGKTVPYFRYDRLTFDEDEVYYVPNDVTMLLLGLRHDFSFQATVKVEYQKLRTGLSGASGLIIAQFAVGF
jgi:hypothetical protein